MLPRVNAGPLMSPSRPSGRTGSAGSTRLRGSPSGWLGWSQALAPKRWSRRRLAAEAMVLDGLVVDGRAVVLDGGAVEAAWSAGASGRRVPSPG